jgi:pimeloyl-ACP methyl ester carboxylesterase
LTGELGSAARPPVLDAVRRRYVVARGVNFHVTEAGPPDGAPVLALHGWPQHHHVWRDLLVDPPAGLRIIAPDLPGYGWSGAAPHRWQKEQVASDLLALLDQLGVSRALLVGHDWGGWIGHLLALRVAARFSAFLALNIIHPWQRPGAILPHLWRFYYQPLVAFLGMPLQRDTDLVYRAIRASLLNPARVPRSGVRPGRTRHLPNVSHAGAPDGGAQPGDPQIGRADAGRVRRGGRGTALVAGLAEHGSRR